MVSLHLASLLRTTLRTARARPQRPLAYRSISSTQCRAAEVSEGLSSTESVTEAIEQSEWDEDSGANADPDTYKEFLERVAFQYRDAAPLNWLSETPFPMNPSFRPPPPISDEQRQAMYNAYMSDPVRYSTRKLSQAYGLSLKRVDAILRLKGLEQSWLKHTPLQTGFQKGMELLLGATTHKAASHTDKRYDVHEADILEHDENRDALRQRYQRAYWESVPETGSEPIVPASLEHATEKARQYALKANAFKDIPQLMPRVPDTEYMKRPKTKVVVLERQGRPSLEFVDVGAKFMDVNDRIKQIARAHQRSTRRRTSAQARRQVWRSKSQEASP